MHGRLRVRTTAEEQEKKRKEQAIKVKAYKAGMARIFQKRENNELDDEMLTLIGHILHKNPDISTLWNIRREYFLHISDNEHRNEFMEKDLNFVEQCLMVNPKSYCAWHHRIWILDNLNNPDWKREVMLCTKYLKLDERNFHCWDYRRYVVEKAGISAEKELEFCTEKIRHNFSNYSSWHYRSKLLPIVHPHPTNPLRPISEDKLKEELELVLSAAFTDPNDSSAWFYQRWLLGYSTPKLDIATFRVTKEKLALSFTQSIDITEFEIKLGDKIIDSKIFESARPEYQYDNAWILKNDIDFSSLDQNNEISLLNKNESTVLTIKCKKCTDGYFALQCPSFEYEFGAGVKDLLKAQLDSCEELLQYEPDSKWTLLTSSLLMRAIDRKLFYEKSLENLTKLESVDSLRIGYYKDLATKWKIEKVLEEWIQSNDVSIPLDLSNLNLTSLPYDYGFTVADSINLSGNLLEDRSSRKLLSLLFAKEINVSSNLFTKTIMDSLIENFASLELKI